MRARHCAEECLGSAGCEFTSGSEPEFIVAVVFLLFCVIFQVIPFWGNIWRSQMTQSASEALNNGQLFSVF